MEKNGIGTKSTRPAIIEIMKKRKVIYKNSRKYFISSLGIFLIENLMKIWLPFLKPTFTRDVENQLEMIKDEKREMKVVIEDIKKDFLILFDKFRANKQELVENAQEYVKDEELAPKPRKEFPLTSANCPFCKKVPMKYINLKTKRFLVCSDDTCKKYLSLPKRGRLKLLNSTCMICGFNIFNVNMKKGNRNYQYYLCPSCWTKGFSDKIDGKGFCSNCENYKIMNNKCVKS